MNLIEAPRAQMECAYCGDPIEPWERCVDRLRGVCGRGEKSGQPMVVTDQYDPEPPLQFHEECEEFYYSEKLSKQLEEDGETVRFCAGCGVKISGD